MRTQKVKLTKPMINSDSLPQMEMDDLDKLLYAKHFRYEEKDADKVLELLTKTMPELKRNIGQRTTFSGIQKMGLKEINKCLNL